MSKFTSLLQLLGLPITNYVLWDKIYANPVIRLTTPAQTTDDYPSCYRLKHRTV